MTTSNFLKWVEALRHFSCLSIQVTKNSQPSIPQKGEVSQISTSRVCRNGSTPTFTVIDPETFWASKHATCNTFDEKQNDIAQENAFCGRSFIMACELVPCRHNILHVSQLNFKISFPMSSIYYSFLSCNAFHAFLSKEFSLVAEKLFPAVRSHTTTIPYCTCHRYRAAAARTWSWSRLRNLSSWGSTTWGTAMDNSILQLKPHLWRFWGISMNLGPVHEFYTVSFTSKVSPKTCTLVHHTPGNLVFVYGLKTYPCQILRAPLASEAVHVPRTCGASPGRLADITGIKWSATWNIYI